MDVKIEIVRCLEEKIIPEEKKKRSVYFIIHQFRGNITSG